MVIDRVDVFSFPILYSTFTLVYSIQFLKHQFQIMNSNVRPKHFFFSISCNFLFWQSRNLVLQNFLKKGHEVRAHSTTHYEAAFVGSQVLYLT